ncbi:class I SAM-dependent methyltransferase [Nonomuraea sp. NPDC049684]|uniref:class I SAM-dependent methyltransferase n=1 Tax=Nonomuraea sp. NPDC049684 TaxID=3364356 RepID=UPI0037AECF3C
MSSPRRRSDRRAASRASPRTAVEADIADYACRAFDAIVFSLSLHHTARLAEAVERARALLAPGGVLIVDEFAGERADRATASWLYDIGAVLSEQGATAADPHTEWVGRHRDEHHLHSGDTMLEAIRAAFEIRELVRACWVQKSITEVVGL